MTTEQSSSSPKYRFGPFEADSRAGALLKNGRRIKLQELPFQALLLLLERPGELVSRDDLRERLWPSDTFLDFDASLNTAIRKLRQALEDSAEQPALIRTIPHHGYSFIAPVAIVTGNPEPRETPPLPAAHAPLLPFEKLAARFPSKAWAVAAAAALLTLAALVFYFARKNEPLAQVRAGGPIRLLVLPFDNLSGDPAQQYFSDGLTDEMITYLGGMYPRRLTVIAPTSAMRYKGTHESLQQIARDLGGVDYILEGSVRRSEGRVRIDAQLFDARNQASLWTESYQSAPGDVLAAQRDVASRVGVSLLHQLLPASAPDPDSEINAQAYDDYLKGIYQLNDRTQEGIQKSIEYLGLSIQNDPRDPRAYAALASAYGIAAAWSFLSPGDAYPKARVAATKALALNDSLAEAHTMLAEVLDEYDWNWPAAQKEYSRALQLNPNSAVTHKLYAQYLTYSGRYDQALAEIRRAQDLDPLSLIDNADVGLVYVESRQSDRAIQELHETLDLDPNFVPAHHFLGWAYDQKGRYDQAIAEFQKEKELNRGANYVDAALAVSLARAGRKQAAQEILDQLRLESKHTYVSPYDLAQIYLALGDKDHSLIFLNKALAEHSFGIVLMASSAQSNPLSNDPRYQRMMKTAGFPLQAAPSSPPN